MTKLDKINLLKEAMAVDYANAAKSLEYFVRATWNVLEPGKVLKWNWHLSLMCEYLEAVESGDIKRLIINVPPRSLKSTIGSVNFPAWVWTRRPEFRFLCATYAQTLSSKHSVATRTIITSDWYTRGFSSTFKLKQDHNQKTEFENTKQGHRIATSIMGAATGKGGDALLIDDPHDTTGAESNTERVATIETVRQKLFTRLDDPKTGRIVVIMQRLHEADLTGELLSEGGWEHLKLPAIAEEPMRYCYPVSQKIKEVQEGEYLHSDRIGLEELASIKKEIGAHNFAGQYLQEPVARSGGIIKLEDLRYYKAPPLKFDHKVMTADLTYEEGEKNDWTVVQVWGSKGSFFFLLDQWREKAGFAKQVAGLKYMIAKHRDVFKILIEKKANGAAVIETLKSEISGIEPVSPHTSKAIRLEAVSPLFESNSVHYPEPAQNPWVNDTVMELVKFGRTIHDDTVDCTTMALSYLRGSQANISRLAALTKK